MAKVYVTVSGAVGSGKSAVCGEVEIAMKALGLVVEWADPVAAQAEKNATHADWQEALDLYRPTVVIEELVQALRPEFDSAVTDQHHPSVRTMLEGQKAAIEAGTSLTIGCALFSVADIDRILAALPTIAGDDPQTGQKGEALPAVLPGHWETGEGLDKAREYAGRSRADLAMPDRTDLALANALYLPDGFLPIQTAAKERMRWLSVRLALAEAELARLKGLKAQENA